MLMVMTSELERSIEDKPSSLVNHTCTIMLWLLLGCEVSPSASMLTEPMRVVRVSTAHGRCHARIAVVLPTDRTGCMRELKLAAL